MFDLYLFLCFGCFWLILFRIRYIGLYLVFLQNNWTDNKNFGAMHSQNLQQNVERDFPYYLASPTIDLSGNTIILMIL